MSTESRVTTIATSFVFAVLVLLVNAGAARAQSTHYATVPYNTSNQVYEVMRISRDSANWSQSGYEITVRNVYFNGGGIVKAFVGYGYTDSGTLTILEAAGQNQPKIFLGSEVVVSGTIKYVPVNIQVPAYQIFLVEVKFGTSETTSITASGQVQFSGNSTNTGATGANHDGSVNFTGNVGIGTTNPYTKLHVSGGDISVDANQGIRKAGDNWIIGYSNSLPGIAIGSGTTTDQVAINSGGSERLRVLSNGNVGIGTSSPAQKLHVAGNVLLNQTNALIFDQSYTVHGNVSVTTDGGDSLPRPRYEGYYGHRFVTWAGEVMRIQQDGKVGIGTTSPAQPLDVNGIGRVQNYIRTSLNGMYLGAGAAADTNGVNSTGTDLRFRTNGVDSRLVIDGSGYVGIGKSPTAALDVQGDIKLSGSIAAKYQDVAEWVPSSEQLAAGTVVVLDSTKSNQVTSSSVRYDTRVAGVVSEQPGIALGEKSEGKVLVATTGRVRVRVDASKGPIHVGDLLVTSDIPGVAMKSEPVNLGGVAIHRPGTLIGKALEPLEKGKGEILVLLSLQ